MNCDPLALHRDLISPFYGSLRFSTRFSGGLDVGI